MQKVGWVSPLAKPKVSYGVILSERQSLSSYIHVLLLYLVLHTCTSTVICEVTNLSEEQHWITA